MQRSENFHGRYVSTIWWDYIFVWVFSQGIHDSSLFDLNCMFYQRLRAPHIAVLAQSPGVVYNHLLLRRETRIPGIAPFSFRIGIWDLF